MGRISIVLVAIPAISLTAFAQDVQDLSRTVLKISPQHFVHQSLKAGVERFNSDHSRSIALFVTGMLGNKEDNPFRLDGYDGVAGELQFRKYLSPMRPPQVESNIHSPGVYLAGYLQSGFCSGRFRKEYDYIDYYGMPARAVSYDFREDIASWGFGFTMGYQRTLWHVLFLEAFIGGGIRFSDTDRSGQGGRYLRKATIIDPMYKGILPKLGLNIGVGI